MFAHTLFVSLLLMLLAPVTQAQTHKVIGKPAPVFAYNDVDGKTHALTDWRGKNLVILFFCSCDTCKPVSRLWGEAQTSGALVPPSSASPKTALETPTTLVFFAGEEDATREYAEVAGFDKDHTVLFPDFKFKNARQYGAIPCPRIFVVDGKGIVRYTNNEAGGKPDLTPAPTLVSRAITALQRVVAGLPVPETKPAPKQKPSGKPKGDRRAKR